MARIARIPEFRAFLRPHRISRVCSRTHGSMLNDLGIRGGHVDAVPRAHSLLLFSLEN